MILALLLSLSLGQVTLFDEGVQLGPIKRLNCVGAGVVCTLYTTGSTTGIITISGGGGVGSGTVTSVSVTTANGVSGSVATSTTTPAITLTLGAITPSSVAASGTVTGSNLSGTNTGDQTITLTGPVTGAGTGSFATTIAAGVVGVSHLSATGTPSATTYLRGDNTWATPAGGSGNSVEVTVTMPSDGSGWAQAVVTGQTWVTGTSKIVCQPFNDGGDSNNTDEVYSLAEFSATTSTRVVSTGFTLTAASPNGVTGTFKFHCLGV